MAVALATVAAAAAFRGPLSGALLRQAAASAGFENPQLKVRSVSLDRVEIADLRAGRDAAAPDLAIDRLEARFSPWELLSKRTAKSITIGPGRVRALVDERGAVSIAGLALRRAEGKAGPPPFQALSIEGLDVDFAGDGEAFARVTGAIDLAAGGQLSLVGEARNVSRGRVALRNSSLNAALEFARSGEFKGSGQFQGGIHAFGIVAESAVVSVEAEASPWRALFSGSLEEIAFNAIVGVKALTIRADESPLLSGPAAGAAIETIEGAGTLALTFANGRFVAESADGIVLRSGEEGVLRIGGAQPIYEQDAEGARIALDAIMEGARAASASLRAHADKRGPWIYEAQARFRDRAFGGVAFGPTSLLAAGKFGRDAADGDFELETHIRAAKVGRLEISDAFATTRAAFAADFDRKTVAFSSAPGDCLRMSSGRFGLEGQNSEWRLGAARLCRADAPLLVAEWGERRHATVIGALTAETGAYRLGATRIEGVPPALDLRAEYDPALQLTTMSGALSGGRVVINGALIASEGIGSISARLDRAALSGEAALERVTIVQNKRPLQVAPILAAGTARLVDEKFEFDYSAATPSGAALGRGVGTHDVKSGFGQTMFRSGRLAFAPGRLQPAGLLPPLRGIVGDASGSGEGEARFAWGRRASDFRSSGALSVADLRFLGPGRAVSETAGVSGALTLDSLAPLKSAGEHSLTVKRLDLDALKLENGTILYDLPGDGTLRVIEAEFPWFGGRIGAYEAVAPLTGGEVSLSLKAENVNLTDMLAFIDIEGLSGEGVIEGVLPLSIAEGKARIVEGVMSAKGPGVVRYVGKAADAASSANKQAKLAFDILRELHFEELTARVDGPLDGDLNFNIVFKGTNDVVIDDRKVASPVVYRISIEAPILALIDQARMSADFRLQMERQVPVKD